jgi:hypothetical protein
MVDLCVIYEVYQSLASKPDVTKYRYWQARHRMKHGMLMVTRKEHWLWRVVSSFERYTESRYGGTELVFEKKQRS